jgi:hypothetical protein
MYTKTFGFAVLCLGLASLHLGCEEEAVDDSRLILDAAPKTLKVGDTSATLTCIKEARNLQGRMQTQTGYTQFHLVSGDTSVIGVVGERRLVARKAGQTSVLAKDKSGTLASDSATIQVSEMSSSSVLF